MHRLSCSKIGRMCMVRISSNLNIVGTIDVALIRLPHIQPTEFVDDLSHFRNRWHIIIQDKISLQCTKWQYIPLHKHQDKRRLTPLQMRWSHGPPRTKASGYIQAEYHYQYSEAPQLCRSGIAYTFACIAVVTEAKYKSKFRPQEAFTATPCSLATRVSLMWILEWN